MSAPLQPSRKNPPTPAHPCEPLEPRLLLADTASTGKSDLLTEGTPVAVTLPATNQTGQLAVRLQKDGSGNDNSLGTTRVLKFSVSSAHSVPFSLSASAATAPAKGFLFSVYRDDGANSPGTLDRNDDTVIKDVFLVTSGAATSNLSLPLSTGTYFARFVAAGDLSGIADGQPGTNVTVNYAANIDAGATLVGKPAAPTNLGVKPSATLPNCVDVSWTDVATNESGYKVERSTDGVNFTMVGGTGANGTTNRNGGLTPGKKYYYRAYAYNAGGNSAYSNVGTIVINPPPAAPTALSAVALTTSRIDLAWVDNAATETGFQVERSTDGTTFASIKILPANARAFSDAAPAANTKYYYRVYAFNDGGKSLAASNVASATTRPLTVPLAPTGLVAKASAAQPGAIDLTWVDNATNEDAYKVERATDGVTFSPIADVPLNGTSYRNTGLVAGKTYTYRVYAYNKAGKANSNVSAVAVGAVPAAPTALAAVSMSTSRIDLSWADNATTESGYEVDRSTDGANFTPIKFLGANTKTVSDFAPAANARYYYRVFAFNAAGKSALASNIANATTKPLTIPLAPTSLSIKVSTTTAHALNLAWVDNATNEDAYKVERSLDGVTFTALADVPLNGKTYTNTGLTAGKKYYYRVYAYNKAGKSAYSNVVSAVAT